VVGLIVFVLHIYLLPPIPFHSSGARSIDRLADWLAGKGQETLKSTTNNKRLRVYRAVKNPVLSPLSHSGIGWMASLEERKKKKKNEKKERVVGLKVRGRSRGEKR
jgi:hypothetical protein